jgi:hypothetical protein
MEEFKAPPFNFLKAKYQIFSYDLKNSSTLLFAGAASFDDAAASVDAGFLKAKKPETIAPIEVKPAAPANAAHAGIASGSAIGSASKPKPDAAAKAASATVTTVAIANATFAALFVLFASIVVTSLLTVVLEAASIPGFFDKVSDVGIGEAYNGF